jgi:hypothetical protein
MLELAMRLFATFYVDENDVPLELRPKVGDGMKG